MAWEAEDGMEEEEGKGAEEKNAMVAEEAQAEANAAVQEARANVEAKQQDPYCLQTPHASTYH